MATRHNAVPSARDFAHVTHTTSLVLADIGFPLGRRRNIICALQGKAGGRSRFECSHFALARALEHTGEQLAAEMAAYREIKALKDFQETTGFILFAITAADGAQRRRTTYEDRITPVAAWAVEQARRSEAWAENPAIAMEQQIAAAVSRLERKSPAASSAPFSGGDAADGTHAIRKVNLASSLTRKRTDVMTRILGCYELVADTAGAEHVVGFAEALATDILQRAHFVAQNSGTGVDGISGSASELSDMSSPLPLHTHAADAARVGGDVGGLQICSPPEHEAGLDAAPDMLAAALAYAGRGWAVFPLHAPDSSGVCSCKRRERCDSPGKHPRVWHGVKEATTNARQITRWWTRWTGANIGLATGEASGLLCLDVDPRNGGDVSLTELIDRYGALPRTAEVVTGGNGRHVFFSYPGTHIDNSKNRLGAGLDIKTSGGYVVAAPSIHASGGRYRWADDVAPSDLPSWLAELIAKPHPDGLSMTTLRPTAATERGAKSCAGVLPTGDRPVGEGSRNDFLFRIGCAMRGRGETAHEIENELARVNSSRCAPPLSVAEVAKIAASVMRYESDLNR